MLRIHHWHHLLRANCAFHLPFSPAYYCIFKNRKQNSFDPYITHMALNCDSNSPMSTLAAVNNEALIKQRSCATSCRSGIIFSRGLPSRPRGEQRLLGVWKERRRSSATLPTPGLRCVRHSMARRKKSRALATFESICGAFLARLMPLGRAPHTTCVGRTWCAFVRSSTAGRTPTRRLICMPR